MPVPQEESCATSLDQGRYAKLPETSWIVCEVKIFKSAGMLSIFLFYLFILSIYFIYMLSIFLSVCLVLFELGPNQKLEETQASSLKCLRQPAQILLDSAVRVVLPADIYI